MVRNAWGDWLSTFDWDVWATLTFRQEYSPDGADRAFRRWSDRIRRDSPSVGYFFGHEVGRLGRLHLHALVGGLEPFTQRTALATDWNRRHGFAYLFPYDPAKGASHYIAKYVTKEIARYDIHAPAQPTRSILSERLPQPVRRLSGRASDGCKRRSVGCREGVS